MGYLCSLFYLSKFDLICSLQIQLQFSNPQPVSSSSSFLNFIFNITRNDIYRQQPRPHLPPAIWFPFSPRVGFPPSEAVVNDVTICSLLQLNRIYFNQHNDRNWSYMYSHHLWEKSAMLVRWLSHVKIHCYMFLLIGFFGLSIQSFVFGMVAYEKAYQYGTWRFEIYNKHSMS